MRLKAYRLQSKLLPFLYCFLLVLFPGALYAQTAKITVVIEQWAPYNYIEERELKGFSVDIVRHLIKDIDANAELQIYPSMRALRKLNSHNRTMFISMFRSPEREARYHWIGPLATAAIYFYQKKGSPLEINSLDDAKKVKRIASRHAGLVFNILTAEGFTNLDASGTTSASIYQKLLHGRCDLGISDSPKGVKYILKKLNYPLDSLLQTNVKVVDLPLYIAVSKDIPRSEVAIWQQALDRMKASGLYQQIYQKYDQ